MEKLETIKAEVNRTYLDNKDWIPRLPTVPTIAAKSISAKPFIFTQRKRGSPTTSLDFGGNDTYVSQPFYLQNGSSDAWSTVLDLNNLHAGIVFSVILSNKPGTDNFGTHNDTILLRNGVTGTAAKKISQDKILWFYHGKPLNDGHLSVSVTVTQDQFTLAYKADGTARDTFIVHGDTPVSKLGRAQIGDVAGIPFYLSIFLKRKGGRGGFINVLDQRRLGYIHGTSALVSEPRKDPLFVKLSLEREQTDGLHRLIDFYELGQDFQHKTISAHQTLVHRNDLSKERFNDIVDNVYGSWRGRMVEVNVIAIVADQNCVAFLTDRPQDTKGMEVPLPKEKILHVTMRLRNRSVKPVYSNDLAKRVLDGVAKGQVKDGDTYIKLPQGVKLLCPLRFHFP
jgi:hypothetical protein